MKPGARALGFAESYSGRSTDSDATAHDADRSTLAGAVVRVNRVADGFVFGSCTVGGTDATEAVVGCWHRLDRPDVRVVFLAGIAPAWFNLLDLGAIHEAVDRPVVAVSFEASPGLEPALREAFDGDDLATRLDTYRSLPDRQRLDVGSETLFYRAVGCPDGTAREWIRCVTPEGARPEPLRVARQAARAADAWPRVE